MATSYFPHAKRWQLASLPTQMTANNYFPQAKRWQLATVCTRRRWQLTCSPRLHIAREKHVDGEDEAVVVVPHTKAGQVSRVAECGEALSFSVVTPLQERTSLYSKSIYVSDAITRHGVILPFSNEDKLSSTGSMNFIFRS